MSLSRNQVIKWLRGINVEGETVLDMGCGEKGKGVLQYVEGTPTEYKRSDLVDYDVDFVTDLNKPYPAEFFSMNGQFDKVFCIETMEHVWNPVQAIETLSKLTKSSLYITVPFINPLHDHHDFLRYTGEFFQEVLPKFGFNSVSVYVRKADKMSSLETFYKNEGMRMSKVTRNRYTPDRLLDIGYMIKAEK